VVPLAGAIVVTNARKILRISFAAAGKSLEYKHVLK